MDSGYGTNTALRDGITALKLNYVAGILPNTSVWTEGKKPLRRKAWLGRGRPPTRLRRSARHRPVQVKQLALSLAAKAWRPIKWREGSADWLASRFARLRVRPAHRDYNRTTARAEEWLLIEWPEGEQVPTKYWLSTLPQDMTLARLVEIAKLRWRIERDYQELKQEVGLGHFRGTRLAWLSSPRHTVHRCLRIPDLRAGDDSPLRTTCRRALPSACSSPWFPTARRRRCEPNAISRTQSRPCAVGSSSPSFATSRDVRAAR